MRGISYIPFSFQPFECFLYHIPGSDCCQRGPICSLRSQLANSSVCIRFINVLIKPRSPLFLPPNKILFERSHSLSLSLVSLFLGTVSIIRLLGSFVSRQPRESTSFSGRRSRPSTSMTDNPFPFFVASFSSKGTPYLQLSR